MNEQFEQERADIRRVKEIYDTALCQIITGALPVLIYIRQADARRISPLIIQDNLQEIVGDIIVYIYAVDSGTSPSNYLGRLYLVNGNDVKQIQEQCVIKYYELPTLLEKSYKVEV